MIFFRWDDMDPEDMERILDECERDEAIRAEAIAAAIKNNPCHHFSGLGDFIVGRHLTVVEVIDELGESHLLPIPSTGLRKWEALGMLTAAMR
jgi:hypothetical protein